MRGCVYELVNAVGIFLERSGDTVTQQKGARQGHSLTQEVLEEPINALKTWAVGGGPGVGKVAGRELEGAVGSRVRSQPGKDALRRDGLWVYSEDTKN